MNSALNIQKYLALNQGRYLRESVCLPQAKSNIYLTTHMETAATDLLHFHETAHLSFVLKGGVIDRRRQSETERSAGESMFFHAGEPHESIYKGFPVKNINIELENEFFRKNSVTENSLCRSLTKTHYSKFTLLKIYKEFSTNDEFSKDSIEMLLLELCGDLDPIKKTPPDWLNLILELLNDNWNKEISLNTMAISANVHPKTISKFFPKFFKCTLGEYRRRIRVEKSLELIRNSKLSLTEIAYECGFYDQSHFTSHFKQLTGFLPKQFRKM